MTAQLTNVLNCQMFFSCDPSHRLSLHYSAPTGERLASLLLSFELSAKNLHFHSNRESGNDRFVFVSVSIEDWKTLLLANQESTLFTVMYKKNQGHGICGAKNVYSSNVKLGNWVEDTVGMDLVSKGRHVETHYNSNTTLSFKDPKEQPPLPSMPINMPTTQELKAKNKEGMSYSLIFDHGLKEITPEERLVTTNMLTIMKRKGDRPEDIGSEKRLLRERSKKMIEDLKQSYTMTTEARYANGHIEYRPDIAPKAMTGRMDPLPKWHRTATLTSTIPGMHK